MKNKIKTFVKNHPEAAKQIVIDGVVFGALIGVASLFAYRKGAESMSIVYGGPDDIKPDGTYGAFVVAFKNGTFGRFTPPLDQ